MNALPTVVIPASRSLFLSERTAFLPQERTHWFRQERSLAPAANSPTSTGNLVASLCPNRENTPAVSMINEAVGVILLLGRDVYLYSIIQSNKRSR